MITSTTTAIMKSRIPQIIATGEEGVKMAVAITAQNIATIAAAQSRYETGNMRAGWQVDDQLEVNVEGEILAATDLGDETRRVFNNVHYAIYHENGFHANGTYVPAQPMLAPAIEIEAPLFEARLRQAYA